MDNGNATWTMGNATYNDDRYVHRKMKNAMGHGNAMKHRNTMNHRDAIDQSNALNQGNVMEAFDVHLMNAFRIQSPSMIEIPIELQGSQLDRE